MNDFADIARLEPQIVWKHFATLCAIPRPSKHEGPLRDALAQWAKEKGFSTLVDAGGNLILRAPATPGREDRPTVTLQGHIDMVCQANGGVKHDFHRDPIRAVLKEIDGDLWLQAEQTTLGADNGIGVALALAALEADDLPHGPLEVLLTVDEEAGMGGARHLEAGVLQGELLINIDTEEWGAVYLGCAGGLDTVVRGHWASVPVPPACEFRLITLKGLCGGHSGIDIHKERGHAIKALIRTLRSLERRGLNLHLAALHGGTSRNALPREAEAMVAVPTDQLPLLTEYCEALTRQFAAELAGVDEGVSIQLDEVSHAPQQVMAAADQQRILAVLHAAPQGIKRWSLQAPGVVETSLNLGVIRLAEGRLETVFMLRSLVDGAALALADELDDLFSLAGLSTQRVGQYPGWRPNPASPLLARVQACYEQEFGHAPAIKVIHAGLECGLIGGRYPAMDMISFGPDIAGAHAPGERVHLPSVAHCWQLLRALLSQLPPKA